jgi:hypothetical protein
MEARPPRLLPLLLMLVLVVGMIIYLTQRG